LPAIRKAITPSRRRFRHFLCRTRRFLAEKEQVDAKIDLE